MRRASLLAVFTVAGLICTGQPAAACSAGPFEPSDHTQLLLLGRVRAVAIGGPSLTTPGKDGAMTAAGFREATLTVDVLRTYRGPVVSEVAFVDRASANVLNDARTGREVLSWAGGSGACGTIDGEPLGKYVLIALARGEDGRWQANRLYGAIYSDVVDDASYRWLLYRHNVALPFLASAHPEPATDAVLVP